MTEFEIASLTARYVIGGGQVLIGLGQIAVVWYFGRQMVQANNQRAEAGERTESRWAEAVERQEQQAESRHEENMTVLKDQSQALQALIRGLDKQGEALQEQGQALQRQGRALETLIARTAGSGTA